MGRLIYIEASPRKQRSSSILIANELIEEFQKVHPKGEVVTIDLWKKRLPSFDGATIDAKYAVLHNAPLSKEQKEAWKVVENIISEFKSGDNYVFSIPMWNFGIPYLLKQYIDILVQPGYTFEMTPEGGFKGLIKGKKAVLICARGGTYPKGTDLEKLDLQIPYMETILRFMGFEEIYPIIIEPTLDGREAKEASLETAQKAVRKIAQSL